mmetsp:Transcript_98478/g.278471  ORF Transcript_98478/g.278471 Transcript_98478/m.278471 type:complete len:204 (+) Transcript_98478:447-1058(+)
MRACVTRLCLLRCAEDRHAALIRRHLDGPAAPTHASDASRGAVLPLRPIVPITVDARCFSTNVRVARLDLPFVQRVAELAPVSRSLPDHAVTRLRATAACAGTARPIGPVAPLAIDCPIARRKIRTLLDFLQVANESLACAARLRVHLTLAGARTRPAVGTTRVPIGPITDNGIAAIVVARPRFFQSGRNLRATARWHAGDRP